MINRRRFLTGTSLLSLSPFVPSMLLNAARATETTSDGRVLVVIQLDGGNDGLNTVVPITDDEYARNRFETRVKPEDTHRLDDHCSLHPSMRAAKELFDDGRLSIVQAVGYPNPDRSHFRSMKIWQTASLDDAMHNSYGWLGRTLDFAKNPQQEPNAVYVGSDRTPVALWGRRSATLAMGQETDLELQLSGRFTVPSSATADEQSLEQFVSRSVLSAYQTADELKQRRATSQQSSTYPSTALGSRLKTIASLLKSDIPSRVFYTSHDGFDTHSEQQFTHGQLLREFSDALKAFLNDLREHKLDDRVLVLAFSEFGRRVRENDSKGTDHGTAGPVFLAGPDVKAGLTGISPDLTDLDDGDIKSQFDFRQVYVTILDSWLNVSSEKVLGEKFSGLPLLSDRIG
jgi:uncharacterized protein (DUF1501 family)